MILPPITKKQKQIINLLAKFRFLKVNQLLKLLNHKDPKRIKEWLQDLKNKKYITLAKIVNPKNVTSPYIYCLDTKAKYILEKNENCDKIFLGRLYKEKNLTENFINHCLFLVDIYLFFLSQNEKGSKLHFFTTHEIKGYNSLPENLPDAYIAVESKNETQRYFLDLFDEYKDPAFLPRNRIKEYISYLEEGNWQLNTDNSPFPTILFILATDRRKKHIFYYGKTLLEKTLEDIELFLTTQDSIRFSKGINIWQKVE